MATGEKLLPLGLCLGHGLVCQQTYTGSTAVGW